MSLPERFHFTQSSLQDYLDCPRRFQLRYVLDQPWPAVESEPLIERERLAELGRRFHQMAQRHTVGVPVEQITASAQDAELVQVVAELSQRSAEGFAVGAAPRRDDARHAARRASAVGQV